MLFGGHPGLELAAAFEFGVELRPEQQRQVGQPQPQQEHDHPGQSAVGFVVVAEVRHIQREHHRRQDPGDDRQDSPGTDPAELGLLHIWGRPIQNRHHQDHEDQNDRPAGDIPYGQGGVAQADGVTHRGGDRPADCEHESDRGDHDQRDQCDQQHDWPQFPDRATLVDLVHAVHCPSERPHIPRRRPQRTSKSEDQSKPGAGRRNELLDRAAQSVYRRRGTEVVDDFQHRVSGFLTLPEQTEQRRHSQQRREQRQHRVIRQRRSQVRALIPGKLPHRFAQHKPDRRLTQIRRRLRFARIIGIRRVRIITHIL